MLKAVSFVKDAKKYGKRLALNIAPPIITQCIRKIRQQIVRRSARSTALPHPSEYSTLDGSIEVPCQVEAYLLCRDKYLKPTDAVLDVGFGLGYGLQIMAAKVENLIGIEIDARAVDRGRLLFKGHPRIKKVLLYDGRDIPFEDKTFDVVTCVDIIEHVEDYKGLLLEMARVARRLTFISTPNRRPEYTLTDGRPKNYWHLREWSYEKFDSILQKIPDIQVEWNFLNGPWDGPFDCTPVVSENTLALIPALTLDSSQGWQDDNLCAE